MAWRDFEVLLAVHRAGSHRGAARALGVDASTIGRRVAALETALGAKLFDRTPAGHALTGAGRAVLPRAERVEAEMVAADRELAGADARVDGTVRVTAPDGFVQYVLVPALAALRRAQPALAIELRADARNLDLSRREADVAVRLERPREPALVAKKLGAAEFGLYASRAYLDARTPHAARDLAAHDFIGFGAELDRLPQQRWLGKLAGPPRYVVRANLTGAQVAACVAGLGLALLPAFVAAREPRLVRVLPRLAGPVRELWAVSHADLRRNARIAVVTSWLATLLSS